MFRNSPGRERHSKPKVTNICEQDLSWKMTCVAKRVEVEADTGQRSGIQIIKRHTCHVDKSAAGGYLKGIFHW